MKTTKPITCTSCPKTFTREESMLQHQRDSPRHNKQTITSPPQETPELNPLQHALQQHALQQPPPPPPPSKPESNSKSESESTMSILEALQQTPPPLPLPCHPHQTTTRIPSLEPLYLFPDAKDTREDVERIHKELGLKDGDRYVPIWGVTPEFSRFLGRYEKSGG